MAKSKKTVWDVLLSRLMDAINGVTDTQEWQRPWRNVPFGKGPRNPLSDYKADAEFAHCYTGSNWWILYFEAMFTGWSVPYWAGPAQIEKAGGNLIEHPIASYILQPLMAPRYEEDPETGEKVKTGLYPKSWRYTRVFNLSQTTLDIDALVEQETGDIQQFLLDNPPIDRAEAIWTNMPQRPETQIEVGINQPCYIPMLDIIQMPDRQQFVASESFYHTLFHEMGHSVKAEKRLGLGKARKAAGTHHKRVEEIIAESTATRLSSECGIADQIVDNTMAYVRNWGDGIKDNPELIFLAFAEAENRARFILGTHHSQEATGA